MSTYEGGRGIASIKDSVDASIRRLEDYIKSKERLIKELSDQQNNNDLETKMGRKTNVWIFQTTNKRNLTREDLDMAKKGKPLGRK